LINKENSYLIVLIIGILLQLSSSLLLFITAGKDPATLPSRKFLQTAYKKPIDNVLDITRNKYLDVVNGRLTKMKYCDSCDIYRPPRTIHCSDCGCCIERLDHHCPWLGTCIGKRNYKYFIAFLWSLVFLTVFSISFSSVHVADEFFNNRY
jgi:palmitoyltransferase ZDHHC9/14/18